MHTKNQILSLIPMVGSLGSIHIGLLRALGPQTLPYLMACKNTGLFAGILHHPLPNTTNSLNFSLNIIFLGIDSWSSNSQTRPHVLSAYCIIHFQLLAFGVCHTHTYTNMHTHTPPLYCNLQRSLI